MNRLRFVAAVAFVLGGVVLFACVDVTDPTADSNQPATVDAPSSPSRTLAEVAPTSQPSPTATTGRERAFVERVVDGDTVVLEGGARVRYIGIDTPEDTNTKECFGDRATKRNRQLVEGRVVELERDVSETDRFGRLLRYIWVDGVMVNELLVAEGYAFASTFPPDVKHQALIQAAQTAARNAELGLWSVCADLPAEPRPSASGSCDPSYPDVCIAPPPPDLDCGDLPFVNIRVLPPDPHHLDGNEDGVGCVG